MRLMPIASHDFDSMIEQVVAHHGEDSRDGLLCLLQVARVLLSEGEVPALARLAGAAFDANEELGESPVPSGPDAADPLPNDDWDAHWAACLADLAMRASPGQLALRLALEGLAGLVGAGAEGWFVTSYLDPCGAGSREGTTPPGGNSGPINCPSLVRAVARRGPRTEPHPAHPSVAGPTVARRSGPL
jgi:hypothetical protein